MSVHRIPSLGLALLLASTAAIGSARAQSSVTIAGDFQSELGCPGDWMPDCATTHLIQDPNDGVWRGTFTIPAGSWQYKVAIDDSWTENYGRYGYRDGPNIPLNLAAETAVTFYYDPVQHVVEDNVNFHIVTLVGDLQSELGCAGDWDPACLRTFMVAPGENDFYYFVTSKLSAGHYEAKVAIDESWAENYGAGGVRDGANIPFDVPEDCTTMLFDFEWDSKLLWVIPLTGTWTPASVTIPGTFQTELGCPGDWMPDCATTHLTAYPSDDVWRGTFNIPAGVWEYKAAIDDSWDTNFGLHGIYGGPNIPLDLSVAQDVKFYFGQENHWITDNVNAVIAAVVGDFQSELGCPGDWQPDCLRAWLQDFDGSGKYIFRTGNIPPGNYECKVAIDESWIENYGAGGVPGGANIPFNVPAPCTQITFTYDASSHVLEVTGGGPVNRPPDCSRAAASLSELWPPDHRLVPIEVWGVTDPDGDPVTVTVTGVTQDEPMLGGGDGHTCPDAVLQGGALSLRAERAGGGNGRVYVVSFTADDGKGGSCDGSVRVCVPHDQGMEPDIVAHRGAAVQTSRGCQGDGDPQMYDALAGCSAKQQGVTTEIGAPEALRLDVFTVRGSQATVAYALPHNGDVMLAVYDISGRRVATVENGYQAAGTHQTGWDAGALSPGMYFYRLRVNGEMVSKSVLVLK